MGVKQIMKVHLYHLQTIHMQYLCVFFDLFIGYGVAVADISEKMNICRRLRVKKNNKAQKACVYKIIK